MPGFRENRSGHIINPSSILGLTAFPGWGLYCAGKHALERLTESLAAEITDHGINVTLIESGYMRTDFFGPQSLGLPRSTVDAYSAIHEITEALKAMPGPPLGEPTKAAAAIITVATTGTAPLHQILGSNSLSFAEARVRALTADIDAARTLAVTTDIAENSPS